LNVPHSTGPIELLSIGQSRIDSNRLLLIEDNEQTEPTSTPINRSPLKVDSFEHPGKKLSIGEVILSGKKNFEKNKDELLFEAFRLKLMENFASKGN
jgi:hypothetical protein